MKKDWKSPKQGDRKRKMVALTLSDEARAALDELAKRSGLSKSRLVEALIVHSWSSESSL